MLAVGGGEAVTDYTRGWWEVWDRLTANLLADFDTRREAREFASRYSDPDLVVVRRAPVDPGPVRRHRKAVA